MKEGVVVKQILRRALLLVCLLGVQPFESASAATYDVHACRLPNGVAAPANGWMATSAGGPEAVLSMDCPGGAISGRIGSGTHEIGQLYGFSFTAPPGTSIAGFDRTAE